MNPQKTDPQPTVQDGAAQPYDQPITTGKEDELNFKYLADNVAGRIARWDPARPLVIGISAPWGSGKTSFLNLVKEQLTEHHGVKHSQFLDFNPWWFTGGNLIQCFLNELAKKLKGKRRQDETFKHLSAYANRILESELFEGRWTKLVKLVVGKGEPVSAIEAKKRVERSLNRKKRRLMVVIDDIDRLSRQEMAQIFSLVKTVACFPYITYLIALDFEVVARGLGRIQGTESGSGYLERIFHVLETIPPANTAALASIFYKRAKAVEPPRTHPWNIFLYQHEREFRAVNLQIAPYFRTPRDVYRLAASASARYAAVSGEVNIADFLLLEALRVFEPGLYEAIAKQPDLGKWLSEWPSDLGIKNSTAAREIVKALAREEDAPVRRRCECSVREFLFWSIYYHLGHESYQVSNAFLTQVFHGLDEDGRFERFLTKPDRNFLKAGNLFGRLADYIHLIPSENAREAAEDVFRLSSLSGDIPLAMRDFVLDPAATLVLLLLAKTCGGGATADELADEFINVIRNSEGIELLAHFAKSIVAQPSPESGGDEPMKTLVQVLRTRAESLKPAIAARFEAAAQNGRLLQSHDIGQILHAWESIAGTEAVQAVVQALTRIDDGALLAIIGSLQEGNQFYRPTLQQWLGPNYENAVRRIEATRDPRYRWPGGVSREYDYHRAAARFLAENVMS